MAAEPLPASSPPPSAMLDGAPPPGGWATKDPDWATEEENWCVPRSDEDGDGEEGEGGWAPAPPELRRLLELVAQRGTLELRRPPRARRPPTPLRESAPDELRDEEPEPPPDRPRVVPQFEFEDEPVAPQPLIDRRRAHGPGRVSRRAALDKVLWDMKRHQALEQQILRTGRDLFPPSPKTALSTPKTAPATPKTG